MRRRVASGRKKGVTQQERTCTRLVFAQLLARHFWWSVSRAFAFVHAIQPHPGAGRRTVTTGNELPGDGTRAAVNLFVTGGLPSHRPFLFPCRRSTHRSHEGAVALSAEGAKGASPLLDPLLSRRTTTPMRASSSSNCGATTSHAASARRLTSPNRPSRRWRAWNGSDLRFRPDIGLISEAPRGSDVYWHPGLIGY